MNYIILLLSFLFTSLSLQAQIKKGQKYLDKGLFEAAITAFENDLEKETNRPTALQELSKIHFNKKYESYNLEKAYIYIGRAMAEFNKLNSADKKKVQKLGFSQIGASKYQNDLIIAAIQQTEADNNLKSAESFLETYQLASSRQIENMTKLRDNLAFEEAVKKNTFLAFEDFFKKYEVSCIKYNTDLLLQAQKKLLESFIADKGWALYPSFEEKYIDNIYVKDQKAAYALIQIIRKNKLEEFQKFKLAYPNSLFNKFAQDEMYKIIMAGTNLIEYDEFVRAYPNYEYSKKIWLRFYTLYLQEYGADAVQKFSKSYPNYPFQDVLNSANEDLESRINLPAFEKAKKEIDIIFILDFIAQNPSSPYVVQLEESMYKSLQKRPLFRGCKKFLTLFPNSHYYNEVLDILYDIYVIDGELVTINQFMMEYPEYKDIEKQKKDLKLAELGAKLKLEDNFHPDHSQEYEDYIKAAAPKERAFVALQRLIEYYIHEKKWAEALAVVDKLAPDFGNKNTKIENLKQLLLAQSTPLQKTNLGTGINSDNHEYIPVLSMDNKSLYFCRLDKNTADKEDENIYVSHFDNGKWQTAEYLEALNTPNNNESPLAISADNQQLIIFNGDMQSSKLGVNGWSEAISLPNTINTSSWDADAFIASNGKALLFVSEREGVLDLHLGEYPSSFHGQKMIAGNRDIFVSLLNEKGEWQEPINLGDAINTPYVERTPFLHPDMKTLYFSSEGHGGLGRLDVFKTTRLDDTWTNWSEATNLGKSINTIQNDWGYRISTDGKLAYFSTTNEQGNEDIYSIELPKEFRPEVVSTITGYLTDYNNKAIEAEIVWEDMKTGEELGRLSSQPITGAFYIALPNNKEYSYFISKKGYFPISNHLDLKNNQNSTEINEKITLYQVDELIEHRISLVLKNLFFEQNKATLKKSSYLELDRLAEFVQKHNLIVNIWGYTDNIKDNLTLYQERTNEVKKHLIKKGCKENEITTTVPNKKRNSSIEVSFQKK